eukprot:295645-Chlamydomonas_euryale.AAC.1
MYKHVQRLNRQLPPEGFRPIPLEPPVEPYNVLPAPLPAASERLHGAVLRPALPSCHPKRGTNADSATTSHRRGGLWHDVSIS